jgi:hypothetical protein
VRVALQILHDDTEPDLGARRTGGVREQAIEHGATRRIQRVHAVGRGNFATVC